MVIITPIPNMMSTILKNVLRNKFLYVLILMSFSKELEAKKNMYECKVWLRSPKNTRSGAFKKRCHIKRATILVGLACEYT